MKTHSVKSIAATNIQQIDYDDLNQMLLVRFYDFKTGKSTVYEYHKIPVSVYDQLVKVDEDAVNSDQSGTLEKAFDELLKKSNYEFSKMEY